jgi:hypothetical protein
VRLEKLANEVTYKRLRQTLGGLSQVGPGRWAAPPCAGDWPGLRCPARVVLGATCVLGPPSACVCCRPGWEPGAGAGAMHAVLQSGACAERARLVRAGVGAAVAAPAGRGAGGRHVWLSPAPVSVVACCCGAGLLHLGLVACCCGAGLLHLGLVACCCGAGLLHLGLVACCCGKALAGGCRPGCQLPALDALLGAQLPDQGCAAPAAAPASASAPGQRCSRRRPPLPPGPHAVSLTRRWPGRRSTATWTPRSGRRWSGRCSRRTWRSSTARLASGAGAGPGPAAADLGSIEFCCLVWIGVALACGQPRSAALPITGTSGAGTSGTSGTGTGHQQARRPPQAPARRPPWWSTWCRRRAAGHGCWPALPPTSPWTTWWSGWWRRG